MSPLRCPISPLSFTEKAQVTAKIKNKNYNKSNKQINNNNNNRPIVNMASIWRRYDGLDLIHLGFRGYFIFNGGIVFVVVRLNVRKRLAITRCCQKANQKQEGEADFG